MFSKKKSRNGVSLIELCVGLVIAIPVFLIVFDCAMMVIGIQFNDQTCREAARMAADGEPNSAESRANSAISGANENMPNIIEDLHLVSVENTATASDVKAVKLNGGTVSGKVTVTTAAVVKSVVVHWFFPKQDYITFQSKQTFPYTYVFPGTTPANE